MKKTLLTVALMTASLAAFAQGKVSMQNDGGSAITLDAANRDKAADAGVAGQAIATTGPLPSGVMLEVGLYGGTASGSLTLQTSELLNPVGGTGNAPGVEGVAHAILSFPGGSLAYFQVDVWDSSYGSYALAVAAGAYTGHDNIFAMTPGTSFAYPVVTGKKEKKRK